MGHHIDRKVDIAEIFENWQTHKFVVVNSQSLNRDFFIDADRYPRTIVLADVGYWKERTQELREWCEQNDCKLRGMTVNLPTEELETLFCLKWT